MQYARNWNLFNVTASKKSKQWLQIRIWFDSKTSTNGAGIAFCAVKSSISLKSVISVVCVCV